MKVGLELGVTGTETRRKGEVWRGEGGEERGYIWKGVRGFNNIEGWEDDDDYKWRGRGVTDEGESMCKREYL